MLWHLDKINKANIQKRHVKINQYIDKTTYVRLLLILPGLKYTVLVLSAPSTNICTQLLSAV